MLDQLPQNQTSTITAVLENIQDVDQCSQLLDEKISNPNTYTDFYVGECSQKEVPHNQHGYKLYTILSQGKFKTYSFKLVINDFLCYLGLIKSEEPVQNNVDVKKVLEYFKNLISNNNIDVESIQMFVYFLIKPTQELKQYHNERLEFIQTCFESEMKYLLQDDEHTNDSNTILSAFRKISIYFVHLDMEKSKELINKYVLSKLTTENIDSFVLDVFTFMGILKSEKPVIVTSYQTAPLQMLGYIIEEFPNLPKSTQIILSAFLGEQASLKYRFSNKSRTLLYKKLTTRYSL